MKRIIFCCWALAGLLHPSALSLLAESPTLSTTKQAAFFRQIFNYDDSLNHGGEIYMLVLEPTEADKKSVAELTEAFTQTGVSVKTVTVDELVSPVDPSTVVYVLPSSDLSLLSRFCSENGVLSISGVPTLAKKGHVSIGLGDKGGSPEIFVNQSRLKAENHKLSSHLLRLAKLIE